MKHIRSIALLVLFGISSSIINAQATCITLDPTVCSPNNGWKSGPFYSCNDNGYSCCWVKEGTMWCWSNNQWVATDYYWRFPKDQAICNLVDVSAGCISIVGGG